MTTTTATTKVYTTATAKAEIDNLISKFNVTDSEDNKAQAEILVELEKIIAAFNEASVNEGYNLALNAKDTHPVLALARQFKYKTIGKPKVVPESVPVPDTDDEYKVVNTATLKEGTKEFDLFAFIEYAAKTKRPVTNSPDWKAEVIKARLEIEKAWKSFFSDEKSKDDKSKDNKFISIGAMKRTLQAALDSIVFIPSKNNPNNNALVVTNLMAKRAFAFCNKRESSKELDNFNVTYKICDTREFNKNFFDMVKDLVHEKCYTITYCTETEETATK